MIDRAVTVREAETLETHTRQPSSAQAERRQRLNLDVFPELNNHQLILHQQQQRLRTECRHKQRLATPEVCRSISSSLNRLDGGKAGPLIALGPAQGRLLQGRATRRQ